LGNRQRTEGQYAATHVRLEAIEAMFKKLERSAEAAPAFELASSPDTAR